MRSNLNCFFRCSTRFEKESHGYYGTARLWDDGIILPQDTRKVSWRCALESRTFIFSLTQRWVFFSAGPGSEFTSSPIVIPPQTSAQVWCIQNVTQPS